MTEQTKITFWDTRSWSINIRLFCPHLNQKCLLLKRADRLFIDIEELHKTQVILFSNAHHHRFDTASFVILNANHYATGLSRIIDKAF
jgi:hypothetical protein